MLVCLQGKANGSCQLEPKKETWAGKDPVIFSFRGMGTACFCHLLLLEDNLWHLLPPLGFLSPAPKETERPHFFQSSLPNSVKKRVAHSSSHSTSKDDRIPCEDWMFSFCKQRISLSSPTYLLSSITNGKRRYRGVARSHRKRAAQLEIKTWVSWLLWPTSSFLFAVMKATLLNVFHFSDGTCMVCLQKFKLHYYYCCCYHPYHYYYCYYDAFLQKLFSKCSERKISAVSFCLCLNFLWKENVVKYLLEVYFSISQLYFKQPDL